MLLRQVLMLSENVPAIQTWLDANVSSTTTRVRYNDYNVLTIKFASISDQAAFDLRWPNINTFNHNVEIRYNYKNIILPDGLRIHGNLDLSYCQHMVKLPSNLHIDGFLNLRMCLNLQELSAGLRVVGDLYLNNINADVRFDTWVGGQIWRL